MKKLTLFLFMLASLATITACKKDKFSDKPAQQKILGKWTFVSVTTETTRSSKVETTTEQADAGDYFDFRSDGKVYFVLNGDKEQSAPYSIENENTLKIDGDSFTIATLTENQLAFEETSVTSTRTRKTTYNLNR